MSVKKLYFVLGNPYKNFAAAKAEAEIQSWLLNKIVSVDKSKSGDPAYRVRIRNEAVQ